MGSVLNRALNRCARLTNRSKGRRIAFATHHKTGTVLARNAALAIQKSTGVRIIFPERNPADAAAVAQPTPGDAFIALYRHSHLEATDLPQFDRVFHFIRNPRELIVSSAAYHRRGLENWMNALPAELDWDSWPKAAPYRFAHEHENPRHFQDFLAGATYSERLNSLSMGEAILYEMQLVAGLTLRDMFAFPSGPNVVQVNIHRPDFVPQRFWKHVLGTLQVQAFSRSLALRELEKLNKANMSQWTARQQAHVNPNPNARDEWGAEHEALFQSLFPGVTS